MALNPLSGQSGSSVTPSVLVDPTDPTRVLKINADGSLNTSGGGTGGSSDVAIHDNTTTAYHLKVNADGSINTAVTSGGGGVASSVALNDGTTTTQKLAIDASGKLGINNFPATQPVSGSVSVSNLPATQPVSGTVAVSNFPAASSTVTLADPTTGTQKLAIDATGKIGINNLPATQPISGSVSVSNFPATQPVSGSVSVSNLSTEQAVNVNQVNGATLSAGNPIFTAVQNFPATQPVSGSVSVSNLPTTQPVSGSLTIADPTTGTQKLAVDAAGKIGVNNFPTTQAVSGTVSVSNFPATQPVSGSVSLAAGSALAGGVNLIDSAGTNKAAIDASGNLSVKQGAALPAGSALIGGTNLVDSAGTNKAAVDASGNLSVKQGGALPAGTNTLGGVNVIDSAGTNKLKVNADGSINTTGGGGGGSSVLATQDGLAHATVPETVLAAYSSGGPILASGLACGLDTDRLRTFQGKYLKSVAISNTTSGDTTLTCSAGAMNLLMPGQVIRLGPSTTPEFVFVATSYVPATSATSIPLQSPVVSSGKSVAAFDSFGPNGPWGSEMLPTGILLQMPVIQDSVTGNLIQTPVSTADGLANGIVPMVVEGYYDAAANSISRQQGRFGETAASWGGRVCNAIAAGVTSNTTVRSQACRLCQILVTAVGTNNMFFYDSFSAASGTIVAVIPSTATIGQIFPLLMPCSNGIVALGNAGNPGVTISNTF